MPDLSDVLASVDGAQVQAGVHALWILPKLRGLLLKAENQAQAGFTSWQLRLGTVTWRAVALQLGVGRTAARPSHHCCP